MSGGRVARTARAFVVALLAGAVALGGGACAKWSPVQPAGDGGTHPDGWVGPDGGGQLDAGGGDGGGACDPDPLPAGAGAQCANAIDLGDLSDVLAEVVTVTGNSMPAGREIWWVFRATDDLDTAGDEFHVDVRFLVNGGDAYEMDVYRNSCSSVDRLCENISGPFDWYTDFGATDIGCSGPAPCGEGNCVPPPGEVEGANVCNDNTSLFYVVVRRTDGLESCDGFTLELSNGFYSAP
jgi:hypothetical protein